LDKRRIAVLPFVNMSADADNEYFSDGITEELITQLSKIGEVGVIARTSAMTYKDSDKSIAEIGRELKVGTILEGSVRKAGKQVRITTQLIDVTSETHLWAESYDRDLADIFAIQHDIAERVANSLEIKLVAAEQQRLRISPPENAEAYNLYLKAFFLWNQGSSENALRAIELLERAVALEPRFAAAYAALADFSNSLMWITDVPAAAAHAQAKARAEQALSIDKTLARAHIALAGAKMYGDFDWQGAEAEYLRALELDPSLARAHQQYGHHFLLASQRRDDEALAHVKRAVELDPLSLLTVGSRAWVHYHRREYDEAIAWFRESHWSYVGIGQSLIFKGMYEEGIGELKRALEITPDYDFLLGYLAWGYGKAGMIEEAQTIVEELKQKSQTETISPMALAWAYPGMGNKDDAIDWLEKAYEAREGSIIFLHVPEFYDVLSSESRYHALLAQMGLES
jgi:serine/threonine-protein kinase